jgi:competence/damage-inducible protein CinA-like protein
MPAEIIAIGTELLLGEIQDSNTRMIARALRTIGLDLFRSTVVGDNPERIAAALRESLGRAEAVITCGGLGPTVDDPTREAVSAALGRPLEFHEELWSQIQERFARFGRRPSENNRRQAYLPQGAIALQNRVGTAPAFYVQVDPAILISLPGVPAELEVLLAETVLPLLKSKLQLQDVIEARIVRTAGIPESVIDDRIQDLERLTNPTVGVLAHPGQIDIRIAAKAPTIELALSAIGPVADEVRLRLGPAVFGTDEDTLETVTLSAVAARGWQLASIERGTQGALAARLAAPAGHGQWKGRPGDRARPTEKRSRADPQSGATAVWWWTWSGRAGGNVVVRFLFLRDETVEKAHRGPQHTLQRGQSRRRWTSFAGASREADPTGRYPQTGPVSPAPLALRRLPGAQPARPQPGGG